MLQTRGSVTAATTVDAFTITAGTANDSGKDGKGGGPNTNSSQTLAHVFLCKCIESLRAQAKIEVFPE